VWLQGIVVADHLELDPLGAEQLARHLRRGDGLPGCAAAGGVGQHPHAKLLDRSKKRWPGDWPGDWPVCRPAPARAVSRRSDMVTTSAPKALTASLITCGEE